jgi:hypothetical protein
LWKPETSRILMKPVKRSCWGKTIDNCVCVCVWQQAQG